MARPKRILYNGAIYHVMARSTPERRLLVDEFDRLRMFELFGKVQQRYAVRWRAVSLMTSHYHAAVETPAANLPEAMQYLNSQYASGWNRRRGTRGPVFGDRFVSKAIEDEEYAWTAFRYIAWNPVESGYVEHPDQWVWASHRALAGLAEAPEFLDLNWLQPAFGGRTLAEAQLAYREAINHPLTAEESTHYLKSVVVGSEGFQEAVRKQIGVTMHDELIPRSYRALARPPLGELFAGIHDLEERNRLIRRAQVIHGYRQSEIARSLNLHPNTVSKIVSGLKHQRFFLVRVR